MKYNLIAGVINVLSTAASKDSDNYSVTERFPDSVNLEGNGEVSIIFTQDRMTLVLSAKPGEFKMRSASQIESFIYSSGDVLSGDFDLSGARPEVFSFSTGKPKGKAGHAYLPTGFCGVYSGPKGGKSLIGHDLLAHAEQQGLRTAVMSMGEPEAEVGGTPLMALIGIMLAYAKYGRCVILADSVREMMLKLSGDTRSGGVKSGLVSFFTSLDRVANKCGICLIGIVNPSNKLADERDDTTPQSDKITASDVIKADMESSTGCQLYLTGIKDIPGGKQITISISHRMGDRDRHDMTHDVLFANANSNAPLDAFDTMLPFTNDHNPLGY